MDVHGVATQGLLFTTFDRLNLARRQKDKNNSTIVDPLLVLVRPTSTTSSSSYRRSSVVLVFECCWDAGFTLASWLRSLIFGRGGGYQCTAKPLPSQGSKMLTYYKKSAVRLLGILCLLSGSCVWKFLGHLRVDATYYRLGFITCCELICLS